MQSQSSSAVSVIAVNRKIIRLDGLFLALHYISSNYVTHNEE